MNELLSDVLQGLAGRPKSIPCKWLYDARGSALFDRICELEEYYPTRVELGILRRAAPEVARLAGPAVRVVELGCGSCNKTRVVLDALEAPDSYVPVDIADAMLEGAAAQLARERPGLHVSPLHADYMQPFEVPLGGRSPARTLAYFPGSTIGNLEPSEAERFLARLRDLAGPGGAVLLGVDLKKAPALLHAAYNDAQGVTAAFNANLLVRINRELGADFDARRFHHYALYAPLAGRIEMHLVSAGAQVVHVAGRSFSFEEGETLVTEHSYKYAPHEVERMAKAAGLGVRAWWTDEQRLFGVFYLAP